MNTYSGERINGCAEVQVKAEHGPYGSIGPFSLSLRLDLGNHSPTGFEWGYGGSGPAQLALAILAHEFGDEFAQDNYQQFKSDVIVSLNNPWTLTSQDLAVWREKQPQHLPLEQQ